MKKLLSYVWPQTRMVKSAYNGMLEVTWMNARKVLDSANANYSYGALQRVMEKCLNQIDLSTVSSVLLLGLGGGSVVESLRAKFSYEGPITAVELDPVVIRLAETEFDIRQWKELRILEGDAFEFASRNRDAFGLIIVDVFIDDLVPPPFYGEEFCRNISRACKPNGLIIFNLGLHRNESASANQSVTFFRAGKEFEVNLLENVEGKNTIMIACKAAPSIS